VLSNREIEARVLPEGGPPESWIVWKRHFERGVPRELERLERALELGEKRVLDVGCGHGAHLLHFSPGSLGVDALPDRVAFARSIGLRAEVRDVETLGWNLGLGDFDLVWARDRLAHVADPVAFLASLPPVLAPKGRIVLCERIWPQSDALAEAVARCLPDGREALARARRRLTARGLAELLEQAGLEAEHAWTHALEPAWLGGVLRPWVAARTIVARRRRAAPQEQGARDAQRRHVLVPHPADPVRRARDLERRGGTATVPRRAGVGARDGVAPRAGVAARDGAARRAGERAGDA
jgi:SAM-dependent methyltransferase